MLHGPNIFETVSCWNGCYGNIVHMEPDMKLKTIRGKNEKPPKQMGDNNIKDAKRNVTYTKKCADDGGGGGGGIYDIDTRIQ